MKPKYLWPLSIVLWLCLGAATVNSIKFFTDYPNSAPVDSDFFVLQRNLSYINSSAAQTRRFFFTQPSFTGSGFIEGQWHVGGDSLVEGIYYGNGVGLSNIVSGSISNSFISVITNNTFINTNVAITFLETNNTFVNTNVFITTSNSFFNNTYVTNLTTENITNNTFVSTNVAIINNITNNTFFTTNVTINQPGGFTNLNLVPLSVMYVDVNDAESTVPNAVGVMTNNGSGGVGFSLSLSLDELDILNGYITNFFTGLTNYGVLGTDANGLLTLGSSTITNISITNAFIQNLTNNTFVNTNVFISTSNAYFNSFYATNAYITTNFSTNLYFVTGKGNTLIVTNVSIEGVQTNKNIAASSAVITKSDQVLTNAVNALGAMTNSASGPPSFGLVANNLLQNSSITVQGAAVSLGGSTLAGGSSPAFSGENMTNFNYMLKTNTGGGSALVFGGVGTSATLYTTNITAATTLAAFTITTAGQSGGFKLYCTCSGGTDRILTFPNGCVGAGLGTPPAVTITNNKAAWFDVVTIPGLTTNVFWSPVF